MLLTFAVLQLIAVGFAVGVVRVWPDRARVTGFGLASLAIAGLAALVLIRAAV